MNLLYKICLDNNINVYDIEDLELSVNNILIDKKKQSIEGQEIFYKNLIGSMIDFLGFDNEFQVFPPRNNKEGFVFRIGNDNYNREINQIDTVKDIYEIIDKIYFLNIPF